MRKTSVLGLESTTSTEMLPLKRHYCGHCGQELPSAHPLTRDGARAQETFARPVVENRSGTVESERRLTLEQEARLSSMLAEAVSRRFASTSAPTDFNGTQTYSGKPALTSRQLIEVQPVVPPRTERQIASRSRRFLAGVIDAAVIQMGVVVFAATAALLGVELALGDTAWSLLLGTNLSVAMLYRMLWCFANADTPGMRAVGVRLAGFNDGRPDRSQRHRRQFAGWLSLACGGLGFLVSVVDAQKLTWHDRLSRTFVTKLP